MEATKELKNLRKLALRGLGSPENSSNKGTLNKAQLLQIGQNVLQLTHLDISSCSTIDDSAF